MSRSEAMTTGSDGRHLCWSCKEETGEGPFCTNCVKIQPVEEIGGFFELFGIEKSFTINSARIKKKYYELSRRYHPDFYSGKSDEEKTLARINTAHLNKALRIMSDPLLRAEYMLETEDGGFTAHPAPPQELFEEILEIGELLVEDGEPGDEGRQTLNETTRNFKNRLEVLENSLDELFARLLTGDENTKAEIEGRINNIKYLRTTLARIDKKLMEAV
ncbi:MAG: Fe-S protein assembly co-chaperone HscB [FCB group bacterium]|nr:Fe-S protein assembly co-chaperone HscB [FCB group bacterium]